jgi:hypothetical protein
MPDFDFWNKVLALLLGVVTLITAVVTLRKSRAEKPQIAAGSPVKLRSFRAIRASEMSPIRRWVLTTTIVVTTIGSVLAAIVSGFTLYDDPSLGSAGFVAFWVTITLGNILSYSGFRPRGPLRTVSKETTLNVEGNYDQVMENCIAALRKMKVRLTAIDSKGGTVEGKMRLSWRSWGEIISVRITEVGPGEYAVHIKSRCSFEGTSLDLGKNASNISTFCDELIH